MVTELRLLSVRHEFTEVFRADPHNRRVVAGLEIEVVLRAEAAVRIPQGGERVGGADRRYRAEFTVGEDLRQLLFGNEGECPIEPLVQRIEFDVLL